MDLPSYRDQLQFHFRAASVCFYHLLMDVISSHYHLNSTPLKYPLLQSKLYRIDCFNISILNAINMSPVRPVFGTVRDTCGNVRLDARLNYFK